MTVRQIDKSANAAIEAICKALDSPEKIKMWEQIKEEIEEKGSCASDISDNFYHSTPAISSSGLRTFHKTGSYGLYFDYLHPRIDSDKAALTLGRKIHQIILLDSPLVHDKEIFERLRSAGSKSPRSTKDYKNWKTANEDLGKVVLPYEEYLSINRYIACIKSSALLTSVFKHKDAFKEISLFSVCPETGLYVKCRPDILNPSAKFIADVKTHSEWSGDWSKTVERWGYEIQSMFYLYVAKAFYSDNRIGLFPFVVFEKERPYGVSIKSCGNEHLENGRNVVIKTLREIRTCALTNTWDKGVDDKVEFSSATFLYMKKYDEQMAGGQLEK